MTHREREPRHLPNPHGRRHAVVPRGEEAAVRGPRGHADAAPRGGLIRERLHRRYAEGRLLNDRVVRPLRNLSLIGKLAAQSRTQTQAFQERRSQLRRKLRSNIWPEQRPEGYMWFSTRHVLLFPVDERARPRRLGAAEVREGLPGAVVEDADGLGTDKAKG